MAWGGIAMLVLGVSPLLVIILAARMGWTDDPNPNPVGPGILAGCTMLPGIAFTVVGVVLSVTDIVRDRPPRGR